MTKHTCQFNVVIGQTVLKVSVLSPISQKLSLVTGHPKPSPQVPSEALKKA